MSRRILIAGGGPAGLEAALALSASAHDLVDIELLAPERHFTYRPLSVAEPFDRARTVQVELAAVAQERGFRLTRDAVDSVLPAERALITQDGERLEYDELILALGARPRVAVPGALTFRGPRDVGRLREALERLERRDRPARIAFVSRAATTWTLPLYELALLTGAWGAERGLDLDISILTAESAPLEAFGAGAGAQVAELLAERGITLRTDTAAASYSDGGLWVPLEGHFPADVAVALPALAGPAVRGIPADPLGFVPVDDHGRVRGAEGVWAVGDMTARELKQGGLATQQADVAALALAAAAGAPVPSEPYRPVLRGLLFTGAEPLYLRHPAAPREPGPPDATLSSPWWPPHKIAGRHLAPYLATHGELLERAAA